MKQEDIVAYVRKKLYSVRRMSITLERLFFVVVKLFDNGLLSFPLLLRV
jgi:hypothetical protein